MPRLERAAQCCPHFGEHILTTTATTTNTAALLAQIHANEMGFAEAHSLAYCRKPLAELDAAQLRTWWPG